MKAAIKQIFESNKTQNEIHTTSDGVHFFSLSSAGNHAKSLTVKSVVTTTREEAFKDETKEERLAAVEAKLDHIKATVEKEVNPLLEERAALVEAIEKEKAEAEANAEANNNAGADAANENTAGADATTAGTGAEASAAEGEKKVVNPKKGK